mgnify:CR=1 FL=1
MVAVQERVEDIKCPACGRRRFYHQKATDTYRCQSCGKEWPAHPKPEAPDAQAN